MGDKRPGAVVVHDMKNRFAAAGDGRLEILHRQAGVVVSVKIQFAQAGIGAGIVRLRLDGPRQDVLDHLEITGIPGILGLLHHPGIVAAAGIRQRLSGGWFDRRIVADRIGNVTAGARRRRDRASRLRRASGHRRRLRNWLWPRSGAISMITRRDSSGSGSELERE